MKDSKEDGKAPYSIDVRMYFSRCYIIQNDNQQGMDLHIHAYTYRVFCKMNAVVISLLVLALLVNPTKVIMSVCYYGSSILAFIISLTTFISYMDRDRLSLPGVSVIKQTLLYSIPVIVFYSFFLMHILSFVLRILLNYYHISINDFNHIPHFVSFVGPLICKYQYWVVGLYVLITTIILPFNQDGIWMISVCGLFLIGNLLFYGKETAIEFLLCGVIISFMLMLLLPFLWRNGYFYFLFPSSDRKHKKEVETNLKDFIDE